MLWQPSPQRIQRSAMHRFLVHIDDKYGLPVRDYPCLQRFSIQQSDKFWQELFDFFPLVYEGELQPAVLDTGFKEYGWFPQVKLNYAQNLLAAGKDEQLALKSLLENGHHRQYTYKQLRSLVAGFQGQLHGCFDTGDTLACYMPNIAETVIAMLAATAKGGVFTSTSADFGIDGVLDRFGQSRPRVLVTCAGYEYNGKYHDILDKVAALAERLDSLEKIIIVDRYGCKPSIAHIAKAEFWHAETHASGDAIEYKKVPFASPLYIMYSSGTTGKPKCIVHCVGGVLLQHIKELGLHSDHNHKKNIFFFTTCGWMMWNWLVSSLFFGGTTTLYEGSPAFPDFGAFLALLESEKVNILGTSPKYLKALEDSDTDLNAFDFHRLETILCTGSPLLPEQYDFIYSKIKSDLLLASISGGTDIIGCFFLGNPLLPVYRGELQCVGLGMDVACLDENGNAVINLQGELVCRQSFPSRPVYFLNDPQNKKLNEAYFNARPGFWTHGDFIKITKHGGAIFYGRSDATLNPGGVRIGTAEIYQQTETLAYIEDAVCVGKQRGGDIDVLLFVKMKPGEELDEEKIQVIKQTIKKNTTPRHVPARVIAVADIPYTRSGKKMELAVSRVINGRKLDNLEAIANPECLKDYKRFAV